MSVPPNYFQGGMFPPPNALTEALSRAAGNQQNLGAMGAGPLPLSATGISQDLPPVVGSTAGQALARAMAGQKQLDRQKMANMAMQQRVMQPLQGQMVGDHYVGPGVGGAIGQVLSAYMTGKRADKLDQRESDQMAGLGQARANYAQEVMGNPQGYLSLISSPDPALQQLGMAMMQAQAKEQITAKDLLPYADPQKLGGLIAEGTAGFTPKPQEMKEVGGILYDPRTLETAQLQGAGPRQVSMNGDLYEQNPTTGQWKKLDNAPKVSVQTSPIINVGNKGNTAYAEGIAKADAERYGKMQDAAQSAQKQLQTVQGMRETLKSEKVFEGPLADIRLQLEGLGSTVGLGDREKVAASREFDAQVKGVIAELITGASGRFMTDSDAKIIREQGPQLADTKEGREKVLEIMERTQRRILESANREIEAANAFKEREGMPITPTYQAPQVPQSSGAPIPLDEYLRQKGGR